jgi:hypothetical protein
MNAHLASDLQDSVFNRIYTAVKSLVVGASFSVQQLAVLVPHAMQQVAALLVPGAQKKEMVVKIFGYLVEELPFVSDQERQLAEQFVQNDLRTFIDVLYQAFSHNFSFKDNSPSQTFDKVQFQNIVNKCKTRLTPMMGAAESVNQVPIVQISTFLNLLPIIMEDLSHFSNLTGLQRRDYAIQIIQQVLGAINTTNPVLQLLILFAQQMLPSVIDVLYNASQNKYLFDQVQTCCLSMKTRCAAGCKK